MELKTFIAETLQQICAGIKEAQSADGGDAINAESAGAHGGNLFSSTYGNFTRVDFDVAVSAETGGGGKGSIKVFGVGAEGGAERKTAYANRITFSVPVRLPDGAKSKDQSFHGPIPYPDRGIA
ncbi:MAG TPA: trypco2 family protein [Pseudolabrys sp.]|nr:trypco2 family protein [Pseudolabrys sp.]